MFKDQETNKCTKGYSLRLVENNVWKYQEDCLNNRLGQLKKKKKNQNTKPELGHFTKQKK